MLRRNLKGFVRPVFFRDDQGIKSDMNIKKKSVMIHGGLLVRRGVVLGLAALLLRFLFLLREGMPMSDEVYYVLSARDILQHRDPGDFLMTFNQRQPVLASLFAQWTQFSSNPLFSARILSMVVGNLTVIPFYFLSRRLAGPKAAYGAAVLYGLAPFAIQYSLRAMNHSFFNLFWICLLLSFVEMVLTGRRRWAVGAGLAACGCYFMRVEGFLFFGGLLVWAFFFDSIWPRHDHRGVRRILPLTTAVFLLGAVPFWLFLKWKTGYWHLTWLNGPSEWEFFLTKVPVSDEERFSMLHFACAYLRGFATAAGGFLKVYGASFLFLTFLGQMAGAKIFSPDQKTARLAVLPLWLLPVFFYPLHWTEPRFFYPIMLVLLIDAGAGIVLMFEGEFYRAWQGGRLSPYWFRLFCCVALILIGVLPGWRNLFLSYRDDRPELKAAGLWLKKNAKPDSTLFGGDIRVCYYAGPACGHFMTLQSKRKFFLKKDFMGDVLKSGVIQWVVDDSLLMKKDYPMIREQVAETLETAHLTKRYEESGISLYQT